MTKLLGCLAGLCAAAALAFPGQALAAGGRYAAQGGTPSQRAEVRRALEASAFDWSLVPGPVAVHVTRGQESYSTKGHIWLSGALLDSGRFSWATVQHEYAHQVDFFLFDDAVRTDLLARLGGDDWCYAALSLPHERYGCERFASTLVWAYWPSPENALRPRSRDDESAAMAAPSFRALLERLVGMPDPAGPARALSRR